METFRVEREALFYRNIMQIATTSSLKPDSMAMEDRARDEKTKGCGEQDVQHPVTTAVACAKVISLLCLGEKHP